MCQLFINYRYELWSGQGLRPQHATRLIGAHLTDPNWVRNIHETYRDFHSSENLFVQFPLDVTVSGIYTATSTEIILVSLPCKYKLYVRKGFFDRTNICVCLKALINKALFLVSDGIIALIACFRATKKRLRGVIARLY